MGDLSDDDNHAKQNPGFGVLWTVIKEAVFYSLSLSLSLWVAGHTKRQAIVWTEIDCTILWYEKSWFLLERKSFQVHTSTASDTEQWSDVLQTIVNHWPCSRWWLCNRNDMLCSYQWIHVLTQLQLHGQFCHGVNFLSSKNWFSFLTGCLLYFLLLREKRWIHAFLFMGILL